jgi:hypothetical protein
VPFLNRGSPNVKKARLCQMRTFGAVLSPIHWFFRVFLGGLLNCPIAKCSDKQFVYFGQKPQIYFVLEAWANKNWCVLQGFLVVPSNSVFDILSFFDILLIFWWDFLHYPYIYFDPLDQFRPILVYVGQFWQFWAILGHFGLFWAIVGHFGPFWVILAHMTPMWPPI